MKTQMSFNNEIEKTKKEIEVLTKKLSFLEELEKTKSPVEEAYKKVYGNYPDTGIGTGFSYVYWDVFQKAYEQAQKDYKVGEFQEPAKDVVSLYERFVNEGAYGMTSFENAIKVVKKFLMNEGFIEDENEEYITFMLTKIFTENS